MLEDLQRVAEGWGVPASTAAYWLLRSLMAEARGESLVMAGEPISEILALRLAARLEGTWSSEKTRTVSLLEEQQTEAELLTKDVERRPI